MHSRDQISPEGAVQDDSLWLAPVDQPTTVHELAERLLGAYQVDGGTVHMAGCLVEDRLFLRAAAKSENRSVTIFLDGQGNEVDPGTVEMLGMNRTVQLERPPEHAGEVIHWLSALAHQKLITHFPAGERPANIDLATVWCKYAQGKLRFTIGGGSVDLPFSGWTRTLKAPAFVCPHSNEETHHLTATDDGRIVAAEQVAVCEASEQRVLAGDLVTCTVTGRRVLPEYAGQCPVTGETILHGEMQRCKECRQEVSPGAIHEGRCEACANLERVSKADPRLARVLDEHPLLDRWRRWSLSETATSYHLTARRWFRRLLVIVDKESFELRLLATRGSLRSKWDFVDRSQYDIVLHS